MSLAPTAGERKKGWPLQLRDTKGLRVRLAVDTANSYIRLPKGTVGHLGRASSWNRLTFIADPCACCGASGKMAGIDRSYLEVITDETA